MKVILIVALLVALATAQRYAVLEQYGAAGCTDTRRVWASVELDRCVTIGGRSGKLVCDGSKIQAFDCASSNCEPSTCRAVQERQTGCLQEQGQFVKLTCGAEPQPNPRDVVARLVAGTDCSSKHLAQVVYPGGCVSGPGMSARASCASSFYRFEQFRSEDCSGTPSGRFAWPAGCTKVPLPGAEFAVDLPKCDAEKMTMKLTK